MRFAIRSLIRRFPRAEVCRDLLSFRQPVETRSSVASLTVYRVRRTARGADSVIDPTTVSLGNYNLLSYDSWTRPEPVRTPPSAKHAQYFGGMSSDERCLWPDVARAQQVNSTLSNYGGLCTLRFVIEERVHVCINNNFFPSTDETTADDGHCKCDAFSDPSPAGSLDKYSLFIQARLSKILFHLDLKTR